MKRHYQKLKRIKKIRRYSTKWSNKAKNISDQSKIE